MTIRKQLRCAKKKFYQFSLPVFPNEIVLVAEKSIALSFHLALVVVAVHLPCIHVFVCAVRVSGISHRLNSLSNSSGIKCSSHCGSRRTCAGRDGSPEMPVEHLFWSSKSWEFTRWSLETDDSETEEDEQSILLVTIECKTALGRRSSWRKV